MFLTRLAAPAASSWIEQRSAHDHLPFLDNLRWVLVALVVTFHAASTYSGLSNWYWFDAARTGPTTRLLLTTYMMCVQAFCMSLLFLIAGHFTRLACDRKGERRFLRDRALRLGLPLLFYVLVIHPVMGHFMLLWSDGPFHWYYRHYLTSLDFIGGSGPLWFVMALLIFSFGYVAIRLAVGWRPAGKGAPVLERWLPGLLGTMVLLTFLARFPFPVGWSVANLFLGSFPQYALMFALGVLAAPRGWLQRVPSRLGYAALAVAAVLGPFGAPALVALDAATGIPGTHPVLGGGTWQSLVYSAWESVLCIAGSLGLLVLFRQRCNGENRLSRSLARASFGVYVLHAPVLVAIALDLHPWLAPPALKWLALSVITVAVTFSFVQLLLRGIPPLRRLL